MRPESWPLMTAINYVGIDSTFANQEVLYEMECIAEVLDRDGYFLRTTQRNSAFTSGAQKISRILRSERCPKEGQDLIEHINREYGESYPHIADMSEKSRQHILCSIDLFTPETKFMIVAHPRKNLSGSGKYALAHARRIKLPIYNILFQSDFDQLQRILWSKHI